jgi:hypothetical protein
MRTCNLCHVTKADTEFRRRGAEGRRAQCSDCESKADRGRRAAYAAERAAWRAKGMPRDTQKVGSSQVVEPGLDKSSLDDLELGPAGIAPIAPVTPEEAHEAAPPGYAVKGVSTLYGASGEVVQQWVKTRTEDIDRLRLLEEAVQRIAEPF